ncbi:MAG: dihydrodipicolinate synthase family protein [Pirellulales bacterium]|nr:dihydrodipicolinate synthase family protein [Pirellulales bacterium]
MRQRITGIFAPNVVPLDEAGDINEDELRRYVDWLIDRGVHGLYPNGSTGEFTRFTAAERRRIVEIVVDQTAGRVPIIAGAAEANVRETLAACDAYGELGVRAVAIVAPFYYKLSPENVYAYFAEIARQSSVDITLYNIPMFASPIDVDTVSRLAEEYKCVTGIKDSSGDVTHMQRIIRAVRGVREDFSVLCGWEPVLLPCLLLGCDGGTHATASVLPEAMRKLFDLTLDRQYDEARSLSSDLQQLFDQMIGTVDFPVGVRAALEMRGIRAGRSRQPMHADHRVDTEELERCINRLLDVANSD